jgi:protein transport protein SEC13
MLASQLPGTHAIGVTAVSWAPAGPSGNPMSKAVNKRLVTSGCDNMMKIWRCQDGVWSEQEGLQGHTDWVRDVAWAPSVGAANSTIASAGQDGQVRAHT